MISFVYGELASVLCDIDVVANLGRLQKNEHQVENVLKIFSLPSNLRNSTSFVKGLRTVSVCVCVCMCVCVCVCVCGLCVCGMCVY